MLDFQNVSIAYTKKPVLENISVQFKEGEITSLIGPNGCGKSTLLQSLIGTTHITGGKIYLDNTDLFSISAKERAKKIAFLPQVRGIIPSLPVRVLVEHGRFPYMGFGRKMSPEDRNAVKQAMDYTGVSAYASQMVDTLSGGVRQRVFLAMVLAQGSDYVVLDEPTTFLDLKGQREFLKLVIGLKNRGKTVIAVLHDIHQAAEISDKVVFMDNLKVVAEGTPRECIESGLVEKIFGATCISFEKDNKHYYFFE